MSRCDRDRALTRLADGELPPGEAAALRRHLESCSSCRARLTLLVAENEAIRGALAPARERPPPLVARRIAATAAALLLTLGALFGLLEVYERLAHSRPEEVAAAPDLDTALLLTADDVPLSDVLADLSDRSGVPVRLSAEARVRLAPEPLVSMRLCKPITLRSILSLLSEFYGLSATERGAEVVLNWPRGERR
jgi:anti-sigma factor RsiW